LVKAYLSHGIGINSTALMLLLEDLGVRFESVFVDHGGDYPETYEYLQYLKDQGRRITIIKPSVEGTATIEEYCKKWRIIPSLHFRWCTSKFKRRPIAKYVKTPSVMFIGIGFDEKQRAFNAPVKQGVLNAYPLVGARMGREECKKFIVDHGLEIPRRSGCWFCPFSTRKEVLALRKEHPDLYERRKELERNASDRYGKPFFLSGRGSTEEMALENNSTLDDF